MSNEPLGLSTVSPAPPAPGEYEAICASVMKSARGRWFLAEYARRNRHADTLLVLAAVARIEAMIRGEAARAADQGKPSPHGAERNPGGLPQAAPPARDVFAAAERIQDLVWSMRERGLAPSICDEIGALASAILSAASLRDPSAPRVHKLNEALSSLERCITALLDDCAERAQAAPAALADPQPARENAPSDPLAALMAMTDEERIALFT
jgi:hypothetical protein